MNTQISLKSCLVFSLILLFQVSAQAKLYGPKRYNSEGLVLYVGGEFFQSKENFNSSGKETSLPSGHEYMLLDVPMGARYLVMQNLGLEAEVKAGMAQSKSKDLLYGGSRTSTNIHEVRFSADYLFPVGNFDIIPELEGQFAFKNIEDGTDSVMQNEGTSQFAALLNVQSEFGPTDLFGYLGYQMRDSRSNLLPWSIGAGFNTESNFFGGRVFGFQSVSDDKDTDLPGRRESLINKVNGGSMKFYSVNPSVISLEGIWSMRTRSNWGLQAHLGFDVAGESYAKGFFAGMNFTMEIGDHNFTNRHRSHRSSRSNFEKAEPEFKEDVENVSDQKYFEAPKPKPKPRPVARPKRNRPVNPSEQQIQNQMDDVEMQIELKRKKRQ